MILYTMMPQELIFPTDGAAFEKFKMIAHDGVPLLVMKENENYYVVRLLSSNPNHYLDSRYLPGAKVMIESTR